MKLYEITAQIVSVQAWIDANEDAIREAGGVLPDEVVALLDASDLDLTAKVQNMALYIRELEAHADAADAEAKRLQQRADVKRKAAAGLKSYLRDCLGAAGKVKVEGPLATVTVQASPPRVTCALDLREESARDALDGWWRGKITYSLDAEKVLAQHQAGLPLPVGVGVTRGTHVRIR